MDDEEVVRDIIQNVVEMLGYTAICTKNGRETIDLFIRETAANKTFAALIFDLTVPGGMGGIETAAEIRKIDRQIPIFMVSGYADSSVMTNPAEYGFTASISKPFTVAAFSAMLHEHIKPSKDSM